MECRGRNNCHAVAAAVHIMLLCFSTSCFRSDSKVLGESERPEKRCEDSSYSSAATNRFGLGRCQALCQTARSAPSSAACTSSVVALPPVDSSSWNKQLSHAGRRPSELQAEGGDSIYSAAEARSSPFQQHQILQPRLSTGFLLQESSLSSRRAGRMDSRSHRGGGPSLATMSGTLLTSASMPTHSVGPRLANSRAYQMLKSMTTVGRAKASSSRDKPSAKGDLSVNRASPGMRSLCPTKRQDNLRIHSRTESLQTSAPGPPESFTLVEAKILIGSERVQSLAPRHSAALRHSTVCVQLSGFDDVVPFIPDPATPADSPSVRRIAAVVRDCAFERKVLVEEQDAVAF